MLVFFSAFIISMTTYAQGETQAKIPAAESKTKLPADATPTKGDLDAEVTDIKLRASSGAKSKYSSSFNMTYSGASLEKPLDDEIPDVKGRGRTSPVGLSGTVGVRYRFDKNRSAYVATGLYRARPFHSRRAGEQLEVDTPHVGYNNTHRARNWEVSNTYLLYIITRDHDRAIGEVATAGYSLNARNNIGQTRLRAGVGLTIFGSVFDKDSTEPGPRGQPLGALQRDYAVSLAPGLQYNATDWLNLYTTVSLLNYSHNRGNSDEPFKFDRSPVTQTVGFGAAIKRDFYLTPYVMFQPENISSKLTTVNLGATINL